MRSRESFNEAAELYDQVRPSYPDEMIEWIIEKAQLGMSDELLEIAPGTGQCTRKFAERNYKIHAVELGDKLAKLLMKNMKGKSVSVDVSAFEDWTPPQGKTYKLIYCATAWHWIDPKIKYRKVSDLLENDGRVAIIWNNAMGNGNPSVMDEAYQRLFSYHKETPHSTKPKAIDDINETTKSTKDILEESGDFVVDDIYEQIWTIQQTKSIVIKGFFSQSSYLSLTNQDKQALNQELSNVFSHLDDKLETSFKSVVYLLKKT